MKRISALVGVLGILVFLAIPGIALASGSSTCQGYGHQTCGSVGSGNVSNGNTPTPATNASSAGTLPFTGLDVVLLVAGGGTLLAAGFVVRRLSRRLD
jgi:hypothetical protein